MLVVQSASKALKGLSFSVAELTLTEAWAAARNLRLIVRLDHRADDEDYEEVLAFHAEESPLCQWIIWRNAEAVFVQPLIGRPRRYGSLAEATEALLSARDIVLTDIKAMHWPS